MGKSCGAAWQRVDRFSYPSHNIQMLPNPMRLPAYGVKQFWHKRLHDDPAHRWFRRLMVNLFKDS